MNKLNFKILGIFELEMRPGKQLFPLNYNNIINDKNIKYNIKAIKLIVRETYGGVRTYINQIMFYEQSAEEVKDLLCSNELNKIYKLSNKKNYINKNFRINNKSAEKNNYNYNNYNSEQIVKKNKNQVIKNNSSKKIIKKNKNYEEKEEESDIYKISDTINRKDEIYNENLSKNMNTSKKIKINNSINNSKRKNEKRMIKITPVTKKPNRQIKTDLKNDSKNNQKKKLQLIFSENKKNDNLTPNKYLQRIKNLNQGNKTTNFNNYNHIQFPNKMFNTSLNSGDNNDIDFDDEEQMQQNSNSFNSENDLENNYNNNQNINGQNNISNQEEYIEENYSNNNINDIKKIMSKTHEDLNFNKRNYNINNNINNIKSNNNSSILTEVPNLNYNKKSIQIKQKLDYLEGNILEIKKTLQDISEGFAFCISPNYIQNFKEEIFSICEEIYNEYYPNYNNSNYKNGNESLMSNSNYLSQVENNENNKIEKDLENQINQKLDEKLDSMQNNIFDKYLKPTINKIGNSMKKNM